MLLASRVDLKQAKRHARDRRARAMAKEEDSRRELRAVHADLVKAEVMQRGLLFKRGACQALSLIHI